MFYNLNKSYDIFGLEQSSINLCIDIPRVSFKNTTFMVLVFPLLSNKTQYFVVYIYVQVKAKFLPCSQGILVFHTCNWIITLASENTVPKVVDIPTWGDNNH